MDFVKVGDLNICYELKGEGHPLVMLRGLTENMDWWEPTLLEELAKRYRLLVFDNRGAGRTVTPREGDITIPQMADDTAGLMDALGIERAHVVGVSMGGMIAQEFALRHPQKVDKLVLCVTFCGGKNTVIASKEVLTMIADGSGGPEAVAGRAMSLLFTQEWLDSNPEYAGEFLKRYMRAPATGHNTVRQFAATTKLDTFDRLPSIKAPTLVLCGTEDLLIPPINSRTIAEQIPGSKLKEYEGVAHGITNQCQEEFLVDLLEFLG